MGASQKPKPNKKPKAPPKKPKAPPKKPKAPPKKPKLPPKKPKAPPKKPKAPPKKPKLPPKKPKLPRWTSSLLLPSLPLPDGWVKEKADKDDDNDPQRFKKGGVVYRYYV